MGYANPMTRRGSDSFARVAKAAGIDGVICVDISPEEDDDFGPALRKAGIQFLRVATPTTAPTRLPPVPDGASDFLHYVSVAGVTGNQQAALAHIQEARHSLQIIDNPPM